MCTSSTLIGIDTAKFLATVDANCGAAAAVVAMPVATMERQKPGTKPTSEYKTAAAKFAEFTKQVAAVDLAAVPVMSKDRCIPRKEQAKLARELFKSLGIKGISVTTPNCSMAQSVDVRLPRIDSDDPVHDHSAHPHNWKATADERCPVCEARRNASEKVEKILLAAFPNHDNRSDSMTDYFDYCWSVD